MHQSTRRNKFSCQSEYKVQQISFCTVLNQHYAIFIHCNTRRITAEFQMKIYLDMIIQGESEYAVLGSINRSSLINDCYKIQSYSRIWQENVIMQQTIVGRILHNLPLLKWESWWNKEAQTEEGWPVTRTMDLHLDIGHTIATRWTKTCNQTDENPHQTRIW